MSRAGLRRSKGSRGPGRRPPLAVLVLVLAGAGYDLRAQSTDPRAAAEARALQRTLEEQGAGSHASGQRPELGPQQLARLVAQDARTLRVGLTPTAFAADGSVSLEYDTAAAHSHLRVEITATAGFELALAGASAAVAVFDAGDALTFARAASGIAVSVSGRALGTFAGPLRVRTTGDAVLVVNSLRRINRLLPLVGGSFQLTPAPYRGELEVYESEAQPGLLRLVDVVELEPYVAGVVPNESLASFHVEALKAQAVAARGYALANLGRFASRGFDLDDSTLSQVYRGQSSETETALAAAFLTEGLLALHEGRILPALYSSSMGGHSEDNEWVFPVGGFPGQNADPALRAIHDSPEPLRQDLSTDAGVREFWSTLFPAAFETHPASGQPLTTLHRWTRTRSAAELLARLRDPSRGWGVPASASRIEELRVTLRGSSGRAMQVLLRGDWGETLVSGWSDLRALATLAGSTPGGTSAASAPNSPSSFDVTRDAAGAIAQVVFLGGGFGHNVGMSQYGSQGRALRGQDFSQILQGYYSGARLGGAPALLRAGVAFATRLRLPSEHATLIVENAGLDALALELDGVSYLLPLRRDEERQVDLTGRLRGPTASLRLRGLGAGAAVARVEVEADREKSRGR